ncbi:MAG: DUF2905 domain-containing protein [candidate division Zixibacteria bacterium]|nr:DUF2905 domain-containing protein [candidate division Zixibacteria bacterium]
MVLLFFDRIPFLGKLPGDISFRSGHTRIYFPIVTCIVISVILSIILNLFRK